MFTARKISLDWTIWWFFTQPPRPHFFAPKRFFLCLTMVLKSAICSPMRDTTVYVRPHREGVRTAVKQAWWTCRISPVGIPDDGDYCNLNRRGEESNRESDKMQIQILLCLELLLWLRQVTYVATLTLFSQHWCGTVTPVGLRRSSSQKVRNICVALHMWHALYFLGWISHGTWPPMMREGILVSPTSGVFYLVLRVLAHVCVFLWGLSG